MVLKNKQTIFIAIAIFLIGGVVSLGISSGVAHAATPPDACFAFNAGTGVITEYYDNENNSPTDPACPMDVDIPATIGGVTVTGIGAAAFLGNGITSVTFPSTVVSIGTSAFFDNHLTSLALPSSLISIGGNAFAGNVITSLVVPNSVTSIGTTAFSNNHLTSLVLPSSIAVINNSAFAGNRLTSVVIPGSVTTIGPLAFSSNYLTSITIPASVTSVGMEAFYNNQLTSVFIHGNPTVATDAFTHNGIDKASMPVGLTGGQLYSYYQDNGSAVRVYASHPGFVAANTPAVYTRVSAGVTYYIGVVLINPASLMMRYVNQANSAIAPQQREVGGGIADYRVASLLAVEPAPSIADLESRYYTNGVTVTKDAPVINGYTAQSPQQQSVVLGAASPNDTVMTFVYDDPAYNGPTAPNTGTGGATVTLAAVLSVFVLLATVAGAGILSVRQQR